MLHPWIRYNPAPMDRKRVIAYAEILFTVIIWGASFIATKIALRDLQPVTLVWVRFAIGVIILGAATAARHQFALPQRGEIPYFALLGFLGITFHQWLQSTGLVTSQASTTAWIVATIPVFMAILSWLFLKEKISWLQAGGILLAALGVLLVVSKGKLGSLVSGHFGAPGDFLILISAPNWAVFSILSRRGLQKHQATQMMFYVMAIGWLLTTLLFIFTGNLADLRNLSLPGGLAVAFLGIICSGFAYIAWYDGLQVIPASQVGVFLYIEPLVTVLVAWLVLGEALLLSTIIGGIIIISGVRLVQQKT